MPVGFGSEALRTLRVLRVHGCLVERASESVAHELVISSAAGSMIDQD